MKANSDRSEALGFGAIADTYDQGRVSFESPQFHTIVEPILGDAGRRVLELGAGTGLLTEALEATALDLDLVATEPDSRLLRNLRSRARDTTTVERGSLEELAGTDRGDFDIVICANVLHWIDPTEASRMVRSLLTPGGLFLALWNFPMLTGFEDIAADVAELGYSTHLFARDRSSLDQSIDGGLTEFIANGRFEPKDQIAYEDHITMSAPNVASLIGSYRLSDCADSAASDVSAASANRLNELLGQIGGTFEVNNLVLGWSAVSYSTDGRPTWPLSRVG